MDSYKYMVSHLPPVYRETNTLKKYKLIADLFETEDYKEFLKNRVLDLANLDGLNLFGINLDRYKREEETIEEYRQFLKVAMFKKFVVPTHDNILKVIKNVVGFYPDIQPLYVENPNLEENDLGYYITYDLTNSFKTEILDELEKFIAAGVKVRRDYFFNCEGVDLFPANIIYDTDVIEIGCNPIVENKTMDLKQEWIFTNIVHDTQYIEIGG